jgi:hypothetical protein
MTPTPGPWAFDGLRVYAPALDQGAGETGLVATVYSCGDGSAAANGPLIASAPVLLQTLHAVWRLVETLDIGLREQTLLRDLITAALDEADGRAPAGTP